jgi:hypothetical protein
MSPPNDRRVTGFISLATPKRAEVSTFTLLSFQRPRPRSVLLTKKAFRAEGPPEVDTCCIRLRFEGLSSCLAGGLLRAQPLPAADEW